VAASAQEAAATWERATVLIREAESRAALAERETRERVSRMETESATALASTRRETEGFAQRIALLKANSQSLSSVAADADRRWEEARRECRERVQELTLLQTRGFELCQAIVGPPKLRGQLSEGMWIVVTRHTEMAKQLTGLQATMFSAA
jgi:hypothetical protein